MVSGRVQGVGFRYFRRHRRRENVHGWVRNLPDGRVEASAEGEADAVARFEQALRHGPRGARVEQLEIEHTVPGWTGIPASPYMTMIDLKTQIRHVPDFPKAGILFYDITTLLQDPAGLRAAIDRSRAVPGSADRFGGRHREPRVHLRRAGRRSPRRRLRAGAEAGQAAVDVRQRRATRSSTAPTRSRFTRTR